MHNRSALKLHFSEPMLRFKQIGRSNKHIDVWNICTVNYKNDIATVVYYSYVQSVYAGGGMYIASAKEIIQQLSEYFCSE